MVNVEDYIDLVHKLVHKRLKQFKHRYQYEELFQVGCMGLMIASKKFDNTGSAKFLTFAYKWIDGYLLKYIRDDKWFMARNRKERFSAEAPYSLNNYTDNSCSNTNTKTSFLELLVDEKNYYEVCDLEILIDKLPSKFREVIMLKYYKGLTQT